MILAAAQTLPHRNNISANLDDHCRFAELAADQGAQLILFPEMSLTGYERDQAEVMAFAEDDPALEPLRHLAVSKQITIIAGAPIRLDESFHIGAFILQPDYSVRIYTKQFLHEGEELFFQPSLVHNPQVRIARKKCGLAICADIDHAIHAERAAEAGNMVYLASLFFTPGGIPKAHRLLPAYAVGHKMQVLMANYCGTSWNLEAGGQSAFWNNNGKLVGALDSTIPGLLIVEEGERDWAVTKLSFEHF
ncbi:MAG: carbon-nitrogen hydrolase family protein [Saprospiraceae bacterium]|nr:carbon-nitrogen hydrolase family protein [Lewinella sp.]